MDLIDKIKKHEGYVGVVYKDSLGIDTIGYGFAIKDLWLDKDVAELILKRKLDKLQKRIASRFGWFYNSPEKDKNVVTNMCYQLGVSGFSKFKKTIYLLETEQYEDASVEMLDSLWAKQTPNRAKELSEILRGINGHTKNSD